MAKKAKSGKSKRNHHSKKHAVVSMRDKIQAVYASVQMESTCCRQCVCCAVSCPQMNQCEAATILDSIWTKWSLDDRKKFIVKCMRYFFSNSMVKPCPLLGRAADGKPGCRAYEDRPLNCRLYGQWSEEAYEKRVERFVAATGIARENLPMNRQCCHVVNVSGKNPTPEEIDSLFGRMSDIDMVVYKYDKIMVDKKYNYRTIHDWALLKYLGEEKLSILSSIFVKFTPEQAEDYLVKFEEEIFKS